MRLLATILSLVLIGLPGLHAEERSELPPILMEKLAPLPVLHKGRLMPLDSYARQQLTHLSNKPRLRDMSAMEWLLNLMLREEVVRNRDVFLINSPALLQTLKISRNGRRYSREDLQGKEAHLQQLVAELREIPEEARSGYEFAVLELYDKLNRYRSLAEYGSSPEKGDSILIWGKEVKSATGFAKSFALIVKAWRESHSDEFKRRLNSFVDDVEESMAEGELQRVRAEFSMNRVDPEYWALICFGLAFLLAMAGMIQGKGWLYSGSIVLTSLGFLSTNVLMALRMYIMMRPPITNLYSTFLFVSWCCALVGILIYALRDRSLGSFCGGLGAFFFLLYARHYSNDGDTMGVMTAVLDSNFWLSVHVLTIMMGYAGCCLAAIVGHIYLIQDLLGQRQECENQARVLRMLILAGLAFTVLGTLLGGIWADQSWGRFWGWDPKENGALLIILWYSIVLHAKSARIIDDRWVAAGAVLGLGVVMIAWLGVNLLGVGLHSYGFHRGTAWGLITLVLSESLFVFSILMRISTLETRLREDSRR